MWNKLGQKALQYGIKKTGNTILRNTFDCFDRIMNEAYGIKPLNSDEDANLLAMQHCNDNPLCKPVIMWEDRDAGLIMNSDDYLYNKNKQALIQEYIGYRRSRIK